MGDWSKIDPELEAQIKQTVDDFHSGRGMFLNSFAQVEYLALDIISKVKDLVQYRKVITNFPRSTGARIGLLDKLVKTPGVLNDYSELLSLMRNTLNDNSETRHYLAHGFSKVTYSTSGYLGVELLRYNPTTKPSAWKPCKLVFEFSEFEFAVSEIDKSSAAILIGCHEMYQRLNFEANLVVGS